MNRGELGWTGGRTVAMPGGPGWSGMFLDKPWAAPAVFDMSKTTGVNRDDLQNRVEPCWTVGEPGWTGAVRSGVVVATGSPG